MRFNRASRLVTNKNGLAIIPCPSASPYHTNGDGIARSPKQRTRAAAGRFPKHSQSEHRISSRRWRRRRDTKDVVWVAGMETSGSHSHQQFVEKQNGQWNQETIGQRRSLHNARPPHRNGNRSNRLLVVGQLLVTRPRRSRDNRGLTNTETSPESRHPHQHRKRLIIHQHQSLEPRKRLAFGRIVRRRFDQSLTSRALRTKWRRFELSNT